MSYNPDGFGADKESELPPNNRIDAPIKRSFHPRYGQPNFTLDVRPK